MKVGEALAQLKREKSRLARLISLRKENVYVEKGKKTPFDPFKLGEEIEDKVEEIRKLKIRIQKTNLDAKITDEQFSLAEAIIIIGDIRGKIAALSKLFEERREHSFRWRDKDEIEKLPQLNEEEIEKEIEKLESYKIQLDNKVQVTNWSTDLNN